MKPNQVEASKEYSILMKAIAMVVIVTFTMLILEPTAVAAQVLHEEYQQAVAKSAREEAAKLADTLKTVETTLLEWQQQLTTPSGQRRSLSLQTQAKTLKQQVIAFDESVQADFQSILTHLNSQQLPQSVLQRHFDTVERYQQEMTTLLNHLEAIITAQDETELNTRLEKAIQHLQPLLTAGGHPYFDPNQLPFNVPNGEVRAPFEEESALKNLFPVETTTQNQVRRRTEAPDDSYLTPTPDIQITSDIENLAKELEYNPVKIYNWVHDNIQFIPTYGSVQGSQLALEARAGNAADTASILMALLKASDIHCQYVYGTILLKVEEVMNWVGGVTSPEAAIQLLGQGGVPVSAVTEKGEISYIKLEHVWVEAFVDFHPSRGARHRTGDTWIPMDASIKQYQFVPGMDIQNQVPFDAEAFAEQLTQNAQINEQEGWVSGIDQNFIQTTLENYQTQMADYIQQTNPQATVGEVIGTRTIIPANRPKLAASLPYRVIAKHKAKELPESLRLQFSYELYTSETERLRGYDPIISFQDSLLNLANKRITLSFKPATDADRRLIESYLPTIPEGQALDPTTLPTSLPGYLIKLKAELKIDGEVVQSGGHFSLGQELSTASAITIGPGMWLPAYDKPIAGEFYAIGIDSQGISAKQLETVKTRMETVKTQLKTKQFEGLTKDGVIGDMLYAGVLSYFAANDLNLKMINYSGKALGYRLPSFGTFSTSLKPSYFFGIPQRVKMAGIRVNIDFLNKTLWAIDNNREATIALTRQIGITASALEHRIPELLFTNKEHPGEAVSAVKALAIAAKEGQKIYTVTRENMASVLPVLNVRSDVKDDIRDAVAVGKVATISKNQITVGSWTGVGYIITDPKTGTGAYMISGGDNGSYIAGFLCTIVGMLGIFIMLTAAYPAAVVASGLAAIELVLIGEVILMLAIYTAFLRIIAHGAGHLGQLYKGVGAALLTLYVIFTTITKVPVLKAYEAASNMMSNIVTAIYAIKAFVDGLFSKE
jgi:hypothetical protein